MAFAFIFDSIGGTEWLVLLGVILIVVGPKNLPAAARKFGEITAQLRRAADEFKRQILSMDQEIRSTVDDVVKSDYVDTPKDSSSGDDPSRTPDDASSGEDMGDRAETESDYYGSEYDENNPYPGHEYYDETQYDGGTAGEASVAAAETPPSSSEPVKPKVDPYAIRITVTTDADRKKGVKA